MISPLLKPMVGNEEGQDGPLKKYLFSTIQLRVALISLVAIVLCVVVLYSLDSNPERWAKVASTLAAGFLSSCILSLLWGLFAKRDFLYLVKKQLGAEADRILQQQFSELRESNSAFSLRHKFGIAEAFPDRDAIRLPERLRKANKRIWIQVTSFSYLVDSSGVAAALTDRARAGVDVCLLGLDPQGAALKQRMAVNPIYETLMEDATPQYKRLNRALAVETAQPIRVLFYDQIPSCAIFLIDDEAIFVPLLCAKRGRDSTHIHVAASCVGMDEHILFSELEAHLKKLIEKAWTPTTERLDDRPAEKNRDIPP